MDIIFLGNVIGWHSDKQLTVKQMSLFCRVSADRILFKVTNHDVITDVITVITCNNM